VRTRWEARSESEARIENREARTRWEWSLVPRSHLVTHVSEAPLRHVQQEAELPESFVPGGAQGRSRRTVTL
jgi:hypothetical protein